jgi:hypothetical protein
MGTPVSPIVDDRQSPDRVMQRLERVGHHSIGCISDQVELASGSLRAAASRVRFAATQRAHSATRWSGPATRSRAAGTRRGVVASASLGAALERPAAGQRTAACATARRRDNRGNLRQLAVRVWKRVGADRERGVSAGQHRIARGSATTPSSIHAEFTREIATHAGAAIKYLRRRPSVLAGLLSIHTACVVGRACA